MNRRNGFSLIEIIAVLLLTALVFGMVRLSLAGRAADQTLIQTVDQLAFFDRMVRDHTKRHGQSRHLIYDLAGGSVSAIDPESGRTVRNRVLLGPTQSIHALILPAGELHHSSVAVAVSEEGYSTSYGLVLHMRHADTILTQYRLVAGFTGHWMIMNDRNELQKTLDALR